ncbi:site-specific integrase [Herbaspirillum rubrisubalbicans Os34]|uniref:Site-specific integrase n=1 Tax=Herbaspirillum rubrisubalbicans Os34 TaxID=1235827 RepID=A0A6M3ZXS4_9BURK|nr:site-specific integrase [Herbaspirillum rubrisubalbicans]QJQ02322.1 site-specific integrase [Herbaspirillum rubrisubalbicans Os34]
MIDQRSKKYLNDDILSIIETIKKESEIDTTSAETKANYDAEIRRTIAKLAARGENSADDFFAALSETRSKATYYRRRAATNYFLRSRIATLLAKLDAATTDAEIAGICKTINFIADIKKLMTIKAGICQIPDPKARASKRRMLGGLSKDGDFREKLYEQFRGSKYQLAFLLATVSGPRPQELQNGLHVRLEGHILSIKIIGSKVKEKQGQEFRIIEYDLSHDPTNFFLSEIVRLIGADAAHGATVSVDSKVNFTSALRRAGKILWPRQKDVTPYVLRHAIASQWKRTLDPDDVSVALGHVSAKTRARYGQAQLMRGTGNLTPVSVRGSSPVRSIKQARSFNIK